MEERPVCVHAAAHYVARYHGFTCYAAPVFGLHGELLGVLNATATTDRRNRMGSQSVVAATVDWQLRVRSGAGPEHHLLPWAQLGRMLERHRGPAAVFGPRGTVRRSRGAKAAQLREHWSAIRAALLEGRDTLDLPDVRLHLEPFHDPDGRLGELLVFAESRTTLAPSRRPVGPDSLERLAGEDPAQQAVCSQARRLAPTDIPILLLSETGTGKELLARAIHEVSAVRRGPFVPLNCAGLAPALVESELFGHGPGAFTGASPNGRDGWLSLAHGGTLFLDEIGDLPSSVQSGLLRFLEDGTFARVGERTTRTAVVRVIAATSRDLDAMVEEGTFRADLYYRICGVVLELPPLRHRVDRVELAEAILAEVAGSGSLSEEARQLVWSAAWPGNVRQLKNALRVAVALSEDAPLAPEHFPGIRPAGPRQPAHLATPGRTAQSGLSEARIRDVLDQADGNVAETARRLGVARSTIYRRLRRGDELAGSAPGTAK